MDRDANYVAVGTFVVVVLAMATVFVLWYSNARERREYQRYEVYFSGSVSGFRNGDTQATATTGTLVFDTPATQASPGGVYAIDGSGLAAGNYVFAQASGNATALTVLAAAAVPDPTPLSQPPAEMAEILIHGRVRSARLMPQPVCRRILIM